ncbi:MAG: hypothetical protein ACLSA6_18240 [Holdemania massiliensis]
MKEVRVWTEKKSLIRSSLSLPLAGWPAVQYQQYVRHLLLRTRLSGGGEIRQINQKRRQMSDKMTKRQWSNARKTLMPLPTKFHEGIAGRGQDQE